MQVAGVEAVGVPGEDVYLRVAGGQREDQLHQKAVELGFGQRIGALVLDRVLGGGDQEGVGEGAWGAIDSDLTLLHGFEEGGLGLGRGAVDLVGEQEVGEDGAGLEGELGGAGVVDE